MQKLTTSELNRKSPEEFKQAGKLPIVLVLDNIRSLHNVGAAFRTADAFLISKIYLCGVTGAPPNKEIEKTALGATQTVQWVYVKNTSEAVEQLLQEYFKLYAVEQVSKSLMLHKFVPAAGAKYALIFGNEVYGVDQEVIDKCHGVIEIPQLGTKHSLNVSVSIGIALWEFVKPHLSED